MDQVMSHILNDTTFVGMLLFALVPFAWREAWLAYASRGWPTTAARLHYIGAAVPRMSDDGPLPSARYSYTVNGVTYESKRWRFGSFMPMTRRDVEQTLAREIKPIDPVVFYDPHKPGRSCLVPGPNEMTLFGPIVASILAVGLLVFGIVGTPT
jgi:hypothetical protein